MKPFTPHTLPLKNVKWENYITLIAQSNTELAQYGSLDKIFLKLTNTFYIFVPTSLPGLSKKPKSVGFIILKRSC